MRSTTGPASHEGTAWHPHRGFETVTYMIDGIFEHKDSTGGGGVITNGDTQWMTAGGGILHIERPPESLVMSGGLFHGIQLWVNLPSKDKMVSPRYQDIRSEKVTLLSSPDGGALVRVIAGDVAGHAGPGITHTPIALVHATIAPAGQLELPWPQPFNALVYALSGRGSVGRRRCVGLGPARGARRRRRDPHRRRPGAGQPHTELRRSRARWSADRRARRGVRTVRDEHPRAARRSVRGLPGRTPRTGACRRRGLTSDDQDQRQNGWPAGSSMIRNRLGSRSAG